MTTREISEMCAAERRTAQDEYLAQRGAEGRSSGATDPVTDCPAHSAPGTYYTPREVTDPACGSGAFLSRVRDGLDACRKLTGRPMCEIQEQANGR